MSLNPLTHWRRNDDGGIGRGHRQKQLRTQASLRERLIQQLELDAPHPSSTSLDRVQALTALYRKGTKAKRSGGNITEGWAAAARGWGSGNVIYVYNNPYI